jgi:hypothetical protein
MLPFSVAVTRRRYAAATAGTDGRPVTGSPTTSTIYASVQPAPGRQLEHLPEGLRSRVVMIAYTDTELRTADQATGLPADELVYQGATYLVERVARWTELIPHYEAQLSLVPESGGAP